MEATEESPSGPLVADEPDAAAVEAESAASATDHDRLRSIVQIQYDFIWRTLRRLGLPGSAADDAAQQVFLVLSRRLDTVAVGAERTFLYRTAVRVACDVRRSYNRQAARTAADEITTLADPTPNPEELTDRKQARAMLDALLDSLEEDLREVFVLFELDRLPVPEIAQLLGIPQGTCSSRLRRAREAFKDALQRMRSKQAHNQARSR